MKDNFSDNSANYARYRPGYPEEIFTYVTNLMSSRENAWDCGTGNGQVAGELAALFTRVHATDISSRQLENAIKKDNILYSLQPAERTDFPANFFDLVVVAQAIHWFDFATFYHEVRRSLKTGGYIAVLGYGLLRSNKATDLVIDNFYSNIIGPYWDEERRYLDEAYKTIPFPFTEIDTPSYLYEQEWSINQLLGYLSTWSAVKHYIAREGSNPLELIRIDLEKAFGSFGTVKFPILFRLGRND